MTMRRQKECGKVIKLGVVEVVVSVIKRAYENYF